MPSRCTCGAELHPNALFCHQCGRPVREEPLAAEPEHIEEPPQATAAPRIGPVGFGNPVAVRAAYLPAIMASLLTLMPGVSLLCFVWYPAAGFLACYLYRRRSGIDLRAVEGAKLGALTGLFSFAASLLVSTIAYLVSSGADFGESFRQAVEQSNQPAEIQRQMSVLLNNPAMLAVIVALGLALWFFIAVGFTAAGGAIGAKLLERED
jgi:hypothetical protein